MARCRGCRYLDATSQWTLDYPPFFAWFEWALAQAAAWADPAMLRLDNLEYASPATVAFQRLSVVATDAVLAGSVALAARPGALWAGVRGTTEQRAAALAVLVLGSAGLLVVDHIHFQYNGVMMGVFLASAVLMTQGRCGDPSNPSAHPRRHTARRIPDTPGGERSSGPQPHAAGYLSPPPARHHHQGCRDRGTETERATLNAGSRAGARTT